MDALYRDMINDVNAHENIMIQQLEQLCRINSGSNNLEGIEAVHHLLHRAFSDIADDIQRIETPKITAVNMQGESMMYKYGDILFIRKRPHLKKRILLCGHVDTVYDREHPFQQLTYLDKKRLNGPGIADMKGGIVVMLQALKTFEQNHVNKQIGWDIVFNADEEIGSLSSQAFLNNIKDNYDTSLVFEPAMDQHGTFAKNRKGSAKITLIASGQAAHAGRSFYEGKNAIIYLAQALVKIDALNKQHNGVTINIGKIQGGTALNVVPDKAVAKLDIRIQSAEQEQWVWQTLSSIIQEQVSNGYDLSVHGTFTRPVKHINAATKLLFKQIQIVGQQLGLKIDWRDSGGCCDGNNLAQSDAAVIDTLGVRGGHIHSPQEYIWLDSLKERASLTALLLAHLNQPIVGG